MKNEKQKISPWRIVVFILSVLFIVVLWAQKDIGKIYATIPKEQVVPLIITTLLVSVLKVGGIAVAVFLVRWIIIKVIHKDK